MLKILFIGDIVGKIGRTAVKEILPKLKKEHQIDLVLANAENSAHGSGITEDIIKELESAGVDGFSLGDHAFSKTKDLDKLFSAGYPLVRPANYSPLAPGPQYQLIASGKYQVLFVTLLGRVFMDNNYDCPFFIIDKILANLAKQNLSAIIIEIHAEATSEKIALKHYLDGRVSAVLGTHTHVMTADASVSSQGTAYISDVGMTGSDEGVIGVDKENIIKTFRTQIRYPHVIPEKGKTILNAVLLKINQKTGRALSIRSIAELIHIK